MPSRIMNKYYIIKQIIMPSQINKTFEKTIFKDTWHMFKDDFTLSGTARTFKSCLILVNKKTT